MSQAQLELIALPNGDFALRNSENGNVLVRIEFATQLQAGFNENSISTGAIAKAMIQAGLDVINQHTDDDNKKISSKETTLH